jgi:NADH-quinone oxidoreductase subunit M
MSVVVIIAILLAGGVGALLAGADPRRPRVIALATVAAALAVFVQGIARVDPAPVPGLGAAPLYAVFDQPWIERFDVGLLLVVDGLSLVLVGLTLLLGLVAVSASWDEIDERPGFFAANLLWTLAGVVGVFTAFDLLLFFVFWEVMLVPMFLLIAIWGHERRAAAAIKFFLFTQISGLLLLFATLALVFVHAQQSGRITFDYFALLGTELDPALGRWLMLGFLLAFLTKLPSLPVHTWLPDAHTQAPTAGSVLLAGILLKTGAYGLIRFLLPLFPEACLELRGPIMVLGAASVLYGGWLAFAQTDFKRVVAYSSIAHMGFVTLGVFAWNAIALQGAVMQMVAHGLSSAALFMIAGMLQHRLHTRELERMGGLWHEAPRLGAVTLFFVAAAVGMPGLANFVGEFLVLLGTFPVDPAVTVAATLGLVLSAIYALSLLQRSFQGAARRTDTPLPEIGPRELATLGPVMLGLVLLGVLPGLVLAWTAPVIEPIVAALPPFAPGTAP